MTPGENNVDTQVGDGYGTVGVYMCYSLVLVLQKLGGRRWW